MLPKIIDGSGNIKAIIKKVSAPWLYEEINGEYTFTFSAVIDEKTNTYITKDGTYKLSIEDDFFDFTRVQKFSNIDGTTTLNAECEHVSYVLNEEQYDEAFFASTGTVIEILTDILNGTPLTVGTTDIAGNFTYAIQERKSRRAMLVEFANQIEGELEFNQFQVSIKNQRGSGELKSFQKGKNINVISEDWNTKELVNGQPKVSYTLEPIELTNKPIELGDQALIIQPDIGVNTSLRVLRYGRNPVELIVSNVEIGNTVDGVEDDFYRIETTQVSKDKEYYGAQIGPEFGFQSTRYDLFARTIMNADLFAMQLGDGLGGYTNAVYFDPADSLYKFNGRLEAVDGSFSGDLVAGTIDIGSGTFTVDAAGNCIANSLTIGGGSGVANLSDAGALAVKDDITLSFVTDSGTLAALNTIDTVHINDDAITAPKIFVTDLAAINATLGTVTAGIIRSSRFYGQGANSAYAEIGTGDGNLGDFTVVRGSTGGNFFQVFDGVPGIILRSGDGGSWDSFLSTYNGSTDMEGTWEYNNDEVVSRVTAGTGLTGGGDGPSPTINFSTSFGDDRYCQNISSDEIGFQIFAGDLEVFANGVYQFSLTP